MKIAIIGAMKCEVEHILEKSTIKEIQTILNYEFYICKYKNLDLVVTVSGIGKVAAGILFSILMQNFIVDKIINIGICGGRMDKTKIGDVVICKGVIYSDVNLSAFSDRYVYGQMVGYPLVFTGDKDILNCTFEYLQGYLLTADQFMTDYKFTERLIQQHFSNYDIYGFDMESAAFAQAAYLYKKDFISIRVISDIVGITTPEEYRFSEVFFAEVSNKVLINILEKLQ